MRITSIRFVNESEHQAECLITIGDQIVSLQCKSFLPKKFEPHQHRIAWLQDALRQLNRMPEYRGTAAQDALGDIARSAAAAIERPPTA